MVPLAGSARDGVGRAGVQYFHSDTGAGLQIWTET